LASKCADAAGRTDAVIEWAAVCCTAYVAFWHKASIARDRFDLAYLERKDATEDNHVSLGCCRCPGSLTMLGLR